ncbi:MAG: AAA family ATPase [Pseudomonadota bacterium]
MAKELPLAAEKRELAVHVRAGSGLIVIETIDEPRAIELFNHVAHHVTRPLFLWTAARGLSRIDLQSGISGNFDKPLDVLRHIDQRNDAAIFMLADFDAFLDDPVIARLVREIVRPQDQPGPTLALIGASVKLPDALRARAVRFDLQAPAVEELEQMIREEAQSWNAAHGRHKTSVDTELLDRLIDNLSGLTMKDARRLTRNAIHDDGLLDNADLPNLMKAKFDLLDPDGVLSFEMETERFSNVAGMPNLKRWLNQRASVFQAAEPPPGLTPPTGILLLGVQGCGKSLAARAAAGHFQVPLLHLDCGALFNRFHGESERNLRESLKSAELMAPCVLWIDEIEKGLAVGDNDGGTSRRMLATLLTWMAERKSRVFMVATANDIQALPPELVRKGRFDEVFFVDLPDEATRGEILAIHLNRRELKPELYDLEILARVSHGFSGAELEHAIVAGLYEAHAEQLPLSNEHIADAIRATRPLSTMMAEPIAELQHWAESRTVKA